MEFPLFLSLPAELRSKIWQDHCPELGPQPQMLQIEFDPNANEVRPGENLHRQTASVRAILSLCADSRLHALRALPNTISLSKGAGLVRYLAPRDLIRLDPEFVDGTYVLEWRSVPGFSGQVVNLAFNLERLPWPFMSATHCFRLCISFPNLRNIFAVAWGMGKRPRDLAWTVRPQVHRTRLVLLAEDEQSGKELGLCYSWPDVPRYERWAGETIPRENMPLDYRGILRGPHAGSYLSVGQRALGAFLEHRGDTLEGMELEGTVFDEEELAHLRRIRLWPVVSLPESFMHKLEDDIRDSGVAVLQPVFCWTDPSIARVGMSC